jgi:hypothetical protein
LLASASRGLNKCLGRINPDSAPARPYDGVQVSMRGGISAASFQNRTALSINKIAF